MAKHSKEANKMNLKDFQKMLHELVHEIRNPLSGIRGFAELLQKDLEDRPDLQRLSSYIIKGADNLNELVTEALKKIDSKSE